MKFKNLFLFAVLAILDYSFAKENCQNSVKLIDDGAQEHRYVLPKQAIHPKVQHGRHKRSIEHTRDENGLHVPNLILTYRHLEKDVVIDLQLNDHLIPDGYFISYQTQDGGKIVKTLNKSEVDLCHYHGTIRGYHNSRVALSTCNGINGIVIDDSYTYHIQSGPDSKINSEHFLFKHTHTKVNSRCGNVNSSRGHIISTFESKFNSNIKLRHKRAASTSDKSFRTPYNSNEDSLYVELVVVVDYNIYANLSRDLRKVEDYAKGLVNIVNSYYIPLNIFIALTGVIVWTERNEIVVTVDAYETLENFVKYREESLVKDHPSDNAHLLLSSRFDCGIVGIAYEGQMCTTTHSGGVTTVHSTVIGDVATTMAHEIGHNFGLEHDDPQYCKCIDPGCLMVKSTSSYNPQHWSSCSLDQFSLSINRGITQCLKNKPKKLIVSNSCGNGFVEPGEQCDCGLPKNCINTCCNPVTCMLYTNATCATGKCCDLTLCQLQTAGYECRKARGDCDLPEYCHGDSEYCPSNVFKRDTEICGLGQAYCYNGKCQSHLDQCKLLWGPSGKPAYPCFEENTNGSKTGNCGLRERTDKYKKCNEKDIYCGLLHCHRLTSHDDSRNQLQYGIRLQHSMLIYKHKFNTSESVIKCALNVLNVAQSSRDPSLTPQGAKCGEHKMCVDQKCESLEILRARRIGLACPDNCNGNGVCNNKGHCHCTIGFAPPTCNNYGAGGSIDSGPLLNIQASRLSFPVIFGVLLITCATAFGVIYWCKNKSIPSPSGVGRKISTAPIEMIEIIRRVSIAPRDIARRVSGAPKEIARRVSNVFNSAITIQNARSRLRRTDNGPHSLSSSRETILNVDDL